MNKITFTLFAALGLILASTLLPTVDAFADPNCSSGCYLSGCTCVCSGGTQHTIPMTLSNGLHNPSLPFNDVDPNSTYHNTLPATVSGSSNPTATCNNGCACTNGTCPSMDACNFCGGTTSCSVGSSCTNPSTGCGGTFTCSGDSCVCSGGPSNLGCGCGQAAPVCGVCGGCTGGQICCSGSCSTPSCDGTCDGAVNQGCGCGQAAPVCGVCGGCSGTCINGSCCISTTCTAPCGTTAGTDNCGNSCTTSLTNCSCPVGVSYTVAPVIANSTNGLSTLWCYTPGTVVSSVTDNESGCGNPGIPSTTCNPAFTLNCSTACSTCSVECTPVCPVRSCTTSTGNCGQACPITCVGSLWYCDDNNTCTRQVIPPPTECFVAGTKVLLANGKETPIERLKTGDILLGLGGAHNKVVKLKIDPKKNWIIYAFNGGRYFVTKNHVFSTTAGWASIDPESALLENPQLKIRKLKIGDVLITLHGSMRIEKITSKTAKDSVVYSLELDGNHEYYADGFLVHNLPIQTIGTD